MPRKDATLGSCLVGSPLKPALMLDTEYVISRNHRAI